jgi:hypothetical protein
MATKTEAKARTPTLDGFMFIRKGADNPRIVTMPTFLTSEFGKAVATMYGAATRDQFADNPHLQLRYDGQQVTGSNIFDTILVDQLVKPFGVRVAMPVDLSNPDIMQAAKGNFYLDSRAVVLRTPTDSYNEGNNKLAKDLAHHVDLKKGPAMMSGFTIEPWAEDKNGYGLRLVPTDDFTAIQDDRLAGKWNGYKFNEVDENGLPKGLDQRNGSRTWYTRNDGLSRLCLDRYLDLGSGSRDLADSNSSGRVALVGGEATGTDFSGKLRIQYAKAQSELSGRFDRAMQILNGEESK